MTTPAGADGDPLELLVTVKAYPNLGRHGEVVCVAGVEMDEAAPRWVRLFPIPFRDLPFSQRFKKYQRVQLRTLPHTGDKRPESRRPLVDSLAPAEILKSEGNWKRRLRWIEPLLQESMCDIQRRQKSDGTSLGVFRPESVENLVIEEAGSDWNLKQQAVAGQPSLLMPDKDGLKKVPFRFKYRYRCSDRSCNGHEQSIVDWEIGQAYFGWLPRYGPSEVLEKIKEKWLHDICGDDKDTMFFVGNQHQHPEAFLVLGAVYPKRSA